MSSCFPPPFILWLFLRSEWFLRKCFIWNLQISGLGAICCWRGRWERLLVAIEDSKTIEVGSWKNKRNLDCDAQLSGWWGLPEARELWWVWSFQFELISKSVSMTGLCMLRERLCSEFELILFLCLQGCITLGCPFPRSRGGERVREGVGAQLQQLRQITTSLYSGPMPSVAGFVLKVKPYREANLATPKCVSLACGFFFF